jgi:hypothetical protein
MRVKILETGEIKELKCKGAASGLDMAERVIIASGGMDYGDFTYNKNILTVKSIETYEWWKKYLGAIEIEEKLLHSFREDYCRGPKGVFLYQDVRENLAEYVETELDTVTASMIRAEFKRLLEEYGIEVKYVGEKCEFIKIPEEE